MLKASRVISRVAAAIVAPLCLVFFAPAALAQSAVATGNATILEALTLTEDIQLDFGRILAGGGGTVTVTQAGAQSCVGVTCFNDAVAAEFTVTGTGGETVDVSADASYTLSGPGTMTATTDAPLSVAIGAGGSSTFNVGGGLTVAGGQAPGVYSGTYNISVAYQ